MNWSECVSIALQIAGILFFAAGTLGLLRFPDAFTRLHAVTKSDNLGLGLLVVGLVFGAESWFVAFKLLAVWLLVLMASATACHLIASSALRLGIEPWRKQ